MRAMLGGGRVSCGTGEAENILHSEISRVSGHSSESVNFALYFRSVHTAANRRSGVGEFIVRMGIFLFSVGA